MNYVAHFYLDRRESSPYFCLGGATPDLLTAYDRQLRLPRHRLRTALGAAKDEDQRQFYRGMLRHLEVDQWFHRSPFFAVIQQQIQSLLLNAQPLSEQRLRRTLMAHVLGEFLLDRALLEQQPDLLDDYYGRLARVDIARAVAYLEEVAGPNLLPFTEWLTHFVTSEFLREYTEETGLLQALNRVLERTGQAPLNPVGEAALKTVLRGAYPRVQALAVAAGMTAPPRGPFKLRGASGG